jgi:prepilin-type N-terminal cleavage/methylation domain-containing protein
MRADHTKSLGPGAIRARPAFTFVEVVLVMLVLGILAGVAAPKLIIARETAALNAFTAQLKAYADAFDMYKADYGVYPNNSVTATLPANMGRYINPADFAKQTPLGGYWDYTASGAGLNAGVGVEYANGVGFPGTAKLLEVDRLLDDGNLATGSLVLVNTTHKWYYWRYGN